MAKRVYDDAYVLPRPKKGTIASRIVTAMMHAGVRTAQQLSLRTKCKEIPQGINRQTIHRWLKESADSIDPKLLFVVAGALGVSAKWLAMDGGDMSPPIFPTHDQHHLLELGASLSALNDGSYDLWVKDGSGRLETAKVRASKALPYPNKNHR